MTRTGRPREFDEREVVDAAKELFWTRGYVATSVSDLVDELGLQRGSLYGAFGDKHGLFLRALARYVEDSRLWLADLEQGPVLPALRALLLGQLAAPRGADLRGCLLGNTAVEVERDDEAARALVHQGLGAFEEALRAALERAHESGELPPGDSGAQARMLLAFVQGLHVIARAEPTPSRLVDAVDTVLAALGPPEATPTTAARSARDRH